MTKAKTRRLRALMAKRKKQRLEKAGWTVSSVRDFLELSDKEAALVEAKLELGDFRRWTGGIAEAKFSR